MNLKARVYNSFFHFSVDDVFDCLIEFADCNKPLFDNQVFAYLKFLHETFGINITLYLFYQKKVNGKLRTLKEIPSIKKDLHDAKAEGWLSFGPHGLDYNTVIYTTTPQEQKHIFESIYKEINRFAGKNSFCQFVRLHHYSESYELASFFRRHNALGLFTTDRMGITYRLGEEEKNELMQIGHTKYNNIIFVRTLFRLEFFIKSKKTEIIKLIKDNLFRYQVMSLYTHECEIMKPDMKRTITIFLGELKKHDLPFTQKKTTKFAFVIYRSWAYEIFKYMFALGKRSRNFSVDVLITIDEPEFDLKGMSSEIKIHTVNQNDNEKICNILTENQIGTAFFYGWSWIIKEPLLSNILCLGLHPSALPMYRGGSPFQHQIIDGRRMSALSLFKIAKGIDDGDIYLQTPLSLKGNMNDIFKRMESVGTKMTVQFIKGYLNQQIIFEPQKNLEKYPPLRRRHPEQSEVSLKKIEDEPFVNLYDFVRCLTAPYPSAFIRYTDKNILISKVKRVKQIKKNGILLNILTNIDIDTTAPLYIKVKDGYAKVEEYTIS